MSGRILVGSCSWTDPTLIRSGRFYPKGVSSAEARLRHYAGRFPIVEVDSTYYAPPTVENAERWAARTPPGFVFDVKAFGLLTGHMATVERMPPWLRDGVSAAAAGKRSIYRGDLEPDALELLWLEHGKALAPLAEAGKLGAVLFQFPPWFTRSRGSIDYLSEVRERLAGWRVAVEFRGGGWMADEAAAKTLRLLDELDLSYVSVDEPQGFDNSTPPVAATTGELAVVRLHGRNADTWKTKSGAASDRFKYLYSDAELQEWAPRVTELAEQAAEVHVLFNNNYEDWGMRNAARMAQLLGVPGGDGQTELPVGGAG
jgi:uncharacterized protein YecE (DUF72 family)